MTTMNAGQDTHPHVPLPAVVGAAWIRHRRTLLAATALVAVLTAVILFFSRGGPLGSTGIANLIGFVGWAATLTGLLGATLVSREYSHGTHDWAWGQDVSPVRWLTATCVLYAGFVVAWALVLGFALEDLVPVELLQEDFAFSTLLFDASPLIQIGSFVFALALGVMFSVLLRRTVPAVLLTFVTLYVSQFVVLRSRSSLLPPVREVTPLGARIDPDDRPVRALGGDSGILDASGQPREYPDACFPSTNTSCLEDNGAVATYYDYQPVDRLVPLRLVEMGLHLAAALVLIVVTVVALRRLTRR